VSKEPKENAFFFVLSNESNFSKGENYKEKSIPPNDEPEFSVSFRYFLTIVFSLST